MDQDLNLSSRLQPALQLWTVHELAECEMVGTLAAIAELGYTAVEFASFGRTAKQDIKRALAVNGLRPIAAHVPYDALDQSLDDVVRDLSTIGCAQAIVPAFSKHLYQSARDAQRLAGSLNDIAARLRAADITFAYHNEADDFAPLGESSLWRILVSETDSGLVELQLDVFTAMLMHQDVLAMLHEQAARVTSLHVCDKRGHQYVPIGQGELDWPAIIAAARGTACRWLVVEHDAPPDPLADAKVSLDALAHYGITSDRTTSNNGPAIASVPGSS